MRKIFIGIAIIVILLMAALAFLPGLIPSDVYKERIETQLSKELGRTVTISGDVKLQSFPFIRAKTAGVTIENYDGFSDVNLLSVDALEARIRLLPLFSKRVEISGFELIKPEISLERRADGRANWEPAGQADTPPPPEEEAVHFKRDGRFENLDPQIEAFTLVDGQVSYKDATTDTAYILNDIDGFLSMPGLSKTLKLDLALDYEGERAEIDLSFDSIRAFLDGQDTPLKATIKTGFGETIIDGKFLPSEALDFAGQVDSEITDADAIQRLSPEEIPYINLVSSFIVRGDITYVNEALSAKNTVITIKGDGLEANYSGDADLADTPKLDGTASFDISSFKDLTPYLPKDTPSLAFLSSAKGQAKLSGTATGFVAKDITGGLIGDGLEADFIGTATYAETGVTADGNFNAMINDLAQTAKTFEIETDYAGLLKTVTAKGSIAFNNAGTTLSNLTVTAENGAVNGRYSGRIALLETPDANGEFTLRITDLSNVTALLPEPIPYSASIKTIETSGKVTTQGETFTLSNLSAQLSNGLLNGSFTGSGKYAFKDADALSLNGKLDSEITDLRALAALNGTDLPPDTASGAIFETIKLSGELSGTTKSLTLKQAKIGFDDIKGGGEVTVALDKAKPFVNANLNLEGLDLRPYMASYSAQNPTGEIQPWSNEPINVEVFKAMNGDFTLSSPNVITDRLSLGQTNISATLREGVLDADLPNLSLYGGGGRVDVTFDASKTIPELTLSAGLDKLNGNNFLSAIAGFTQASGQAKTELSIKGVGRTQAELIKSLNGQGGVGLKSGQIKGIDAAQFLSGLEQTLTARQLPSGIGSEYATAFKDLAALFEIKNGVVSIDEFTLVADDLAATGLGTIDLGNQTLDFRFRPKVKGENANKLSAFGVPLKFSGGFGSASASLDGEFLTEIVTARARAAASDRITGSVKGPLGGILGGVIGGNTSQTADTTPDMTNGNTDTAADTTKDPTPEEAVTNAIGGLLGIKKPTNKEAPTPSDEKPSETDTDKKKEAKEKSELEKALGSLFDK